MKSVTVRDCNGQILVKVLHRKNGEYQALVSNDISHIIDIEVRDNKNKKVCMFPEDKNAGNDSAGKQ